MNRTTYLLRCWQTKQIARGMLDNTMNCMMERMGLAPLDVESDTPQREGTQIEDEAILIAIQRYGLQCHVDDVPVVQFQQESPANFFAGEIKRQVLTEAANEPSTNETCPNETSSNETQDEQNFETSVQCDVSCSESSSSQVPQQTPVPPATAEEQNIMNQPTALSQIEHDSFLDAAVAVAIQKKGLSVLTGTAESG
jgi:hypothetical protein